MSVNDLKERMLEVVEDEDFHDVLLAALDIVNEYVAVMVDSEEQ